MGEELTASKFDIMSIMNIGIGNFEKIQKDSIVRKYGYYAGGYKRFEITKELFERIKELRNKIIKQTKCNLEYEDFVCALCNGGETLGFVLDEFTEDMNMCYNRQCKCKGCFFENFFTKYDRNFAWYDQSLPECRIKDLVREAIRLGYKPNETRRKVCRLQAPQV